MVKHILVVMFFILTLNATVTTNDNVTKLYVATFKRAPDASGLNYWVNTSGLSLESVADSFFDQTETQLLYPDIISNTSFINSVYDNLFNRLPDTNGFTYWLEELDSGRIQRSAFILAVINGALDTQDTKDATILNNKTTVGTYFADNGLSDLDEAVTVIKDVTNDTSTVSSAISYIDTLVVSDVTDVYSNVVLAPHNKSSIPMLVVLVNYNNISISSSDSDWSSKMFGNNEHELNHYFTEVSNSKFSFKKVVENSGVANDGVISVKLNKNHPDIDIDNSFYSTIVHSDLKTAMQSIDSQIDFSNYDSDANGYISSDELIIVFVMAGYEDSYEGIHIRYGTWGHESCMVTSDSPVLDGVTLMRCSSDGNYAIFGERHNVNNPHDATIGIIAHELGHAAFNFPDLYNISSSTGGIGNFGLMGGGTWATQNYSEFAGNTPVHLSAWSKVYAGWVTPTEGYGSEFLNETSSENYNVVKVSINDDEYYLLENRNNSGYDKGLFSLNGIFNGGIAIWHINKRKLNDLNFENNTVNSTTSDKGVDLIEAANATIDTVAQSPGNEKALFYSPNVSYLNGVISSVSERGSTMTLNID